MALNNICKTVASRKVLQIFFDYAWVWKGPKLALGAAPTLSNLS